MPAAAPPRARLALAVLLASLVTVAVSAWLAARPGAEDAQTSLVVRMNNPAQPLAALLAVSNPLLRPVPLLVLALALVGWVLLTAADRTQRLECLRALAVAVLVAEFLAQVFKRIVDQPRPTAVIPGLDVHGYPQDPFGRAYPSAHTAVTVAVVAALWPWTGRPQRAAGLVAAVLVPLNRIYIGAHWPMDVVGGAAVGLVTGAASWTVAARWPIAQPRSARPPSDV
jgi:membrane-associated phospholipid phosphatase